MKVEIRGLKKPSDTPVKKEIMYRDISLVENGELEFGEEAEFMIFPLLQNLRT
jgi:hypothetical protein